MSPTKSVVPMRIAGVLIFAFGCSGSSNDATSGVGGASAQGGSSSSGASATRGGSGNGGSAAGNTLKGGASSFGGTATSGRGGTVNGGSVTTGGVVGGGGAPGGSVSGGSAVGAASNGGVSTGGKATGGSASGGASSGGKATGGNATGGKAIGGASLVGGNATGGANTGGANTSGANTGGAATGGAGGNSAIALPTANASFDYQIGGPYKPAAGVRVVSRDRNSPPAAGLYNICYVNGFQIQPDEESFWTGQHPNLVLRDGTGKPIVDEGWGEILLDTSTAAKRTELATIIGGWIAKCKTDGFDAVEIDNLDSYSRSNGLLTQANNVAFMSLLANSAHGHGLAIAQKNSSELLSSVKTMGTDFAIVEECNRYDECDTYKAAYGNLVFIIEYRAQDFQTGCGSYPELSIVLRDLNVSTPSSSSYVYQGC